MEAPAQQEKARHAPEANRVHGNGSPAIQPGFNKGRAPQSKGKKLHNVPLTAEEIAALLEALPSDRYPTGARNRAMVALMYRLGFKPKQIVEMPRHYYERDGRTLTVPAAHQAHEKAGKQREMHVDALTRAALDRWLDVRKQTNPSTLAPLFCTHQRGQAGSAVSTTYINTMLRRAAKKAGIEKRVSPMVLRATYLHERERDYSSEIDGAPRAYLNDEAFRRRYKHAHDRWAAAAELDELNAERHATSIGLYCREAMEAFADELPTRRALILT